MRNLPDPEHPRQLLTEMLDTVRAAALLDFLAACREVQSSLAYLKEVRAGRLSGANTGPSYLRDPVAEVLAAGDKLRDALGRPPASPSRLPACVSAEALDQFAETCRQVCGADACLRALGFLFRQAYGEHMEEELRWKLTAAVDGVLTAGDALCERTDEPALLPPPNTDRRRCLSLVHPGSSADA